MEKLLAPLDGENRFCGFKGVLPSGKTYDMTGYDKLFLADLTSINVKESFSKGVCVKECPKKNEPLKY